MNEPPTCHTSYPPDNVESNDPSSFLEGSRHDRLFSVAFSLVVPASGTAPLIAVTVVAAHRLALGGLIDAVATDAAGGAV